MTLTHGVYVCVGSPISQAQLSSRPQTHPSNYSSIPFVPFRLIIQVLLIHDAETDKASAAMDVGVGSLHDGDVEGLAHFCEHMLFLGTDKFPEEQSYSKYLNVRERRSGWILFVGGRGKGSDVMSFSGTQRCKLLLPPSTNTKITQQNGGHSNAYTDMDHTNYFFSVLPPFLEGTFLVEGT